MIGCDFSYRHYEECIVAARANSYEFYRFCDYEEGLKKRSIFMRHDVDHCLDLAVKMAEFENRMGVRTTYFIRVHSKNYNILSLGSSRKLRHILDLGHEIGLHYERSYGKILQIDPLYGLKHDVEILENAIGRQIIGLSPHEPSRDGDLTITTEILQKVGLKYQAYDDVFFKRMKYISDSSCNWREGCMHEFVARDLERVCILTHPFWWYEETPLENY